MHSITVAWIAKEWRSHRALGDSALADRSFGRYRPRSEHGTVAPMVGRWEARARTTLVMMVALASATGCAERRAPPGARARALASAQPALSAATIRSATPAPRGERPVARLPAEMLDPPTGASSASAGTNSSAPSAPSTVIVDELVDVAPAGPASAHSVGVILVDKRERVHVARRGPLARVARPSPTPLAALELPRDALAPYARGPAITGPHAYWISQGRLVRRRLDNEGSVEVLTRDARSGTRVAAAAGAVAPAMVAYVVKPDAERTPRARLWIEGSATIELTPDGSGASSVALAAQKNAWIALVLDGRSGMTPLHARRIVRRGKRVALGPDVVAWVGASSQSTTEVMSAARGDDIWGLVAIERDVLHFGLAQIHIGREPHMDSAAEFVPFANGINTTAVASASFCGRTMVIFARPSSAQPGAPQELVLAELSERGLLPGEVVARSRAFADASLASIEGGALLCYTADHRTWAATLRCRT